MYKFKFLIAYIACSSIIHLYAQVEGDWHQTGPIAFPTNISGQIHGIGRTTQLKFDPIDDNTIWATTASGGLYVSHDIGANWTVTGTDALQPLNCASVCIDFTNNQILYLGTGDPNYYYESYGIYKSTDGGDTWTQSTSGMGNRMALELLMKPDDHNTLIAATDDGIFKTTDAGANWSEKLDFGNFTDMIYKPDNSGVIYAVTYSGNYFKSTDWGNTWTDLTAQIDIPADGANGMRLGVSADDASVVYVAMIADDVRIARSNDSGNTFTTVKTGYPNLNGYSPGEGGQGNYNFDVTVDPDDVNKVYVVAHVIWKSTDGAATWTQYTDWYEDCHTDMHEILHNPHNHSMLLDANDGGIFVSYDEGDTWQEYANGLGATEIYHAAQSALSKDIISIGTQDNGELYYGYGTWYCNRGGDWGARMFFDYLTFNRVYYYNGYRRIVTGGDQNWNAPFEYPDGGSVRMAFTPANSEIGYVSQYEVWRCDNLSSPSPTWLQLTDFNKEIKALAVCPTNANIVWAARTDYKLMYTTNALSPTPTWTVIPAPFFSDYVDGLAISGNNPDIVYFRTYDKVYRTGNAGATWSDLTYDLPAVNLNGIYLDDYSDNESVYVSNAYGVYYHDNTMGHWDNYSQGLPTIADIQDLMIFNDGSPNSVLRVGYYGKGVWESPLYQPHPIPAADFAANQTIVCEGTAITFTDASTDNTDSWAWTFEGGLPASSTEENPVVVYNTSGTYAVTLTATNANGSDSESKTAYIVVSPLKNIPLVEGFQDAFLPADWTKQDANNDGVFWSQVNVGAFGASNKSARFDNYYNDVAGARDGLLTPQYDFSSTISATLTFDVAYAKYSNDYPDSLIVAVSTDCGESYTNIYIKTGDGLATAPDYTADVFVPADNEWRTETIDLSSFLGAEKVSIAFFNVGHYGQGIYIDNVNISGVNPVHELQNTSMQASLYPNPVSDITMLALLSSVQTDIQWKLTDALGNVIEQQKANIEPGAPKYIPIDVSKLAAGIYIITIADKDSSSKQLKLIKN